MNRICKAIVSVSLFTLITFNSFASDTPRKLASNLIKSFENYDVVLYESLIYPVVLKKLKSNNLERYVKNLRQKFKEMRKISEYESHQILITNIISGKDYKPNSLVVRLINNKWGLFPVLPTKRLKITAVDNGKVSIYTEQAITKYNNKWYIVWPTEIYEAN